MLRNFKHGLKGKKTMHVETVCFSSNSKSLSSCLPYRILAFSLCAHPAECTQLHSNYRWVWNGTQRDAYIIKWTRVQMKLLSQPIKVNYQRQNAAARKSEGPPRNCIALMNNIISENGEETHSFTYQHETEQGKEGEERVRWNTTLTT